MAQRLDKWLVYARLTKHRATACDWIEQGALRVNRQKVVKPSQAIKCGDIITVVQQDQVRVLRVKGEAERRGPASAVASLYEDLTEMRLARFPA